MERLSRSNVPNNNLVFSVHETFVREYISYQNSFVKTFVRGGSGRLRVIPADLGTDLDCGL